VPHHDPEQYPPKKKMIRVVIWHPFLEIWAKVKNFLRLSHLYCPFQCSTTYDWLTGSSGHRIFQSRWQPMTGLTAEFLDDWHSRPRRGSALQWTRAEIGGGAEGPWWSIRQLKAKSSLSTTQKSVGLRSFK
jgi:hypothetical protein